MDTPPPPPSQPPPTSTAPTNESLDSSPSSIDDHPPSPGPASKLRLMVSYGGHIVPRPHDKSLCYVGGDTRIVVVDRHVSLLSLSSKLSSSLLNNCPFTLKYQLPNEDLDSLISVTTDEDLENMIDEYDRTNAVKSRLRLFLFPSKSESSQSVGPMIEKGVVKTEDWFVDALNGTATVTGLLNRGFSESASASVNCLLGLDDDGGGGVGAVGGGGGVVEGVKKKQGQDVHSVPDSPMLETTSSFGSTSSLPSLSNLPPIKVHVDNGVSSGGGGGRGVVQDQKMVVGIEEQFGQISVGLGSGGNGNGGVKQDDTFGMFSSSPSPPPMPVSFAVPGVPMVVGEFQNRVVSDDERSDHGYRKPLQQPQTLAVPTQQKSSFGDVASPDSVSSDSSFSNAINRQKSVIYQDQVPQMAPGVSRVAANPVDSNTNMQSAYILQPQFDQQQQLHPRQQFIHAGAHYIQHHPGGTLPISAYYPVYPPPQQQQQHLPQHHHQLDQKYPVYYVQARQPQAAYNMPAQQSSIGEGARTQPPANPLPTSAAHTSTRNAPVSKPEMGVAGMYRQVATGTPQFIQVANSQHQQQYVYSQAHHPPQSVAPNSAGMTSYAYEYADPAHTQVYYTQPLPPTIPSQYQTVTGSAAVMLPEASAQLRADTVKQLIRTSQPI